jgi:uncharacterized protein (DUF885 family)
MHHSLTVIAFLAASFVAVAPGASAAPTPRERLHALGDELLEREYDLFPALEAFQQGAGPRAKRTLVDLAPGFRDRARETYQGVLQRLDGIPREPLDERGRIDHDMLRLAAESGLAGSHFPLREIGLLTPSRGLLTLTINVATGAQPLRTEADFEAWRVRVEATAATYDHAIAVIRAAARQGWTTPRALVEKGMRQIEAVANASAEEGPFWSVMARYPQVLAPERRQAYEARYRAALEGKLLPAMRRLAAFARDEYLPMTRESAGLGAMPGGERAYRALVLEYTTLDRSPDEIHALGLAEVARIRGKLLEAARPLGFKGEMREFAGWLQSNRANYPFRSADEVLARLRAIHARVEPQLPKLFRRLPKAPFEIRLTDPAVAASASATYSRPLPDGSRPGVFRIPVVDPARVSASGLTSLLLHEGMPGHHLDIGRAIELDLPRFRKAQSLSVYSEGWGLYAESLGHELGVYDEPWALVGRYLAELHRAARLVVDTGMHAKGWTREQAIRYLVEERGAVETSAIVAIERYMATPGQALAYKTGELEILALREEARRELGGRFDLRDFHEAVLAEGQVSLPILRERVRTWIARQKLRA